MTQCKQPGELCLVATPLGNLKDITVRAIETLTAADIIVCEDTRVTRKLLSHLGIHPPALWTYHEHNAATQRPKIIERVLEGDKVALVSDAGTPCICDPGYKLVRELQAAGGFVTGAPGPNACILALILSGLPTDAFFFSGFLPRKSGERKSTLEKLSTIPGTLIFYESANRLLATLRDIQEVLPGRKGAVARELTKRFEEVQQGTLEELHQYFETKPSIKGEIVILVEPPLPAEVTEEVLTHAIDNALKKMSLKDAVLEVSQRLNLPRKRVYALALEREDK